MSADRKSPEEIVDNLSTIYRQLAEENGDDVTLSIEPRYSQVIICPDDGKQIAFRGRCPKCGGNSWVPAGAKGGVFEQMRSRRLRELMSDEWEVLPPVMLPANMHSNAVVDIAEYLSDEHEEQMGNSGALA